MLSLKKAYILSLINTHTGGGVVCTCKETTSRKENQLCMKKKKVWGLGILLGMVVELLD